MVGRRPIVPPSSPSLPSKAFAFMDTLLHKALDGDLPSPPAKVAAARPDQNSILKHPTEKEFLAQIAPKSVGDAPLPSFDPGIFNNEILRMKLYPTLDPKNPLVVRPPVGNIVEGTYIGTQLALTQAYSRIEQT
jgi:hypothetical protein